MPDSPAQMQIFVSHSQQAAVACQSLVAALRGAGADIWYDEHNLDSGRLMDVIERELRQRPVFLVMLSPAALASQWVKDECSWAYRLARRDPARIILPILVEPIEESDIWLWLQDYKRIEAPGIQPFTTGERIRRTLRALVLTPQGEQPSAATPQPSENLDDLLTQGQALNFQQKHTEALPFFQRATQDDPNSFMAWYNLGVTLNRLKRYADALAAHDRATALDASYANAWHNQGIALARLNRYNEAVAAFKKAAEFNPNEPATWYNEGLALKKLGRVDEALVAYDRSLALDPNFADAWIGKGSALNNLKRYKEALIALERATTVASNNAIAWYNKGLALEGLQRYQEALEAYERGFDPNDYRDWYARARLLRVLGRKRAAEEAERRARALGG